MTDNQAQQQSNMQAPNQAPMAPFGGAVPFTNIAPQVTQTQQVVYPGGPESAPIQISQEVSKATEQKPESQKINENKIEHDNQSIERREQKPLYPQNQQPAQQANNQKPPAVIPGQPLKPIQPGPKFYGYMVAPQIANNFQLIAQSKGRGKSDESRTWIYMLLDRILKKQAYVKK